MAAAAIAARPAEEPIIFIMSYSEVPEACVVAPRFGRLKHPQRVRSDALAVKAAGRPRKAQPDSGRCWYG